MITAPTPYLDSIRTLHKKGCQSHCQYKQGRLYTCVDATLSRDCHRLPSKADSMIKLYASRPLNTFWFFRNVFILIRIYLKWNKIYVKILERRCRNTSLHVHLQKKGWVLFMESLLVINNLENDCIWRQTYQKCITVKIVI